MNDEQQCIDKFGKFIVQKLRDETIEYYERLAEGTWKAPMIQKLQNQVMHLNKEQKELIQRCIRECVDHGIHEFLFAFQEQSDFDNEIKIIVKDRNIIEISDGIHGESFGEDGWYARFSKYGEIPEEA